MSKYKEAVSQRIRNLEIQVDVWKNGYLNVLHKFNALVDHLGLEVREDTNRYKIVKKGDEDGTEV